jgi:hypothetical protein
MPFERPLRFLRPADDRCEEREITAWQLVAESKDAELVRERPGASLIRRLSFGSNSQMAVRSKQFGVGWRRAGEQMLVTVYFRD